jgi:hypothetical protein
MGDGSRFELERVRDGTLVRLVMAAPEVDWEREYDEMREGWTSFVMQLRFALERHPGEDRRTLRLAGAGEPPVPLASDPEEPYEGATRWGEPWAGVLHHRTAHQVGLTVDSYGPGLVIVHFGRMAIVTTYGLDDDAFAALERRWRENY